MSNEPSKKKAARKSSKKTVKPTSPTKRSTAPKTSAKKKTPARPPVSGGAPVKTPSPTEAPVTKRTVKEYAEPGRHHAEFAPTDPQNRPQPINPSTTIIAKCNTGFGNALYLRGDGPGLSWDRGAKMDNVAADEWMLIIKELKRPFECKLLINDEIWATGPNVRVTPGSKTVLEAFTFE